MFEYVKVYLGEERDLDALLEELVNLGFQRVDQVLESGDFAKRGDIVDVFLVDFQDPIRIEFHGTKVEKLVSFDLGSGRAIQEHKILILLPIKGIARRRLKVKTLAPGEELPIENFIDIEAGDYVVHVRHGIGRYLGIQKVKVDQHREDHIVLEYADEDRLYVPMYEMHLIQKYIGFEGRPPRLYKLGTKVWQKVKSQTKRKIWSFARELLELQAARSLLTGFSFSADTDWQTELEIGFPYEETPDQAKSTEEVKRDMEFSKPMDRLICGDVGYGKTEVALRAAFKAVMDNKQVALLVPTTILAEQHYKNFKSRLANFPVNVEMLSRFKTSSEQGRILRDLERGVVDIVIGTHRLLSDDVKFKDLSLVIVDEEQRFGVRHKEKLKRLRLLVDVLTLTATPIPRTLYMSLMGAKEMSIINTPPPGRLPIKTFIGEHNERLITSAIARELSRGGQVYYVYNRVQGIDRVAEKLRGLTPEARIEVGHGQMPAKELEDVMMRFVDGEIDVLVSTTIIESGIDIPNANTLIVDRADTFGLAELYQLRGRVGRFKVQAYALFLVPKGAVLTAESEKRLRAIEKFTELGSGFKIAMEDLQIRGAGNLLGTEQHGFIMTIGFDLYCRLLREAVEELRK